MFHFCHVPKPREVQLDWNFTFISIRLVSIIISEVILRNQENTREERVRKIKRVAYLQLSSRERPTSVEL